MKRLQESEAVLQDQAVNKYTDISAQYGQSGGFWDSQDSESDSQLISKFTTSIFLAAPPPSMTLKMLSNSHNNNESVNSADYVSRSTQRSRSPTSPSVYSGAYTEIENAPKKLLTSSFYTTTRPFPAGQALRIIPPAEKHNSANSGSTSSGDSGIVSFDISLPSQNKLVIDKQNSYSPNSSEMICSSQENSSNAGYKESESSNSESSTYQIPAFQKSGNKSIMMFNTSNRRASFEIQATESNPNTLRSQLEIPGYRRHSVQTALLTGISDGHFSLDDCNNNNKYKDFEEDVLVDLLKKCTDFPERRKIRSALRHVRENQKVSDDNSSSVNVPTVVSMARLALSTDTEHLVPVYTSTPRDVDIIGPDENENLFVSPHVMYPEEQETKSDLHSSYSAAPGVKSSSQEIHLVFRDSQNAKKSSVSSGDKREQNTGTVNTTSSSFRKVSRAGRTTAKAVSEDSQPEKARVKSALHGTRTGAAAATASSSAKASIKVKLADSKHQQKSASRQPGERAKSAGSVRERSKDSKTSSVPILSVNSAKRAKETSGINISGARKLSEDVKESSRSRSPIEKAADIKTGIVPKSAKSASNSSKQVASQQTTQTAKAKNAVSTHKIEPSGGKVTGSKSAVVRATSDSIVVVGASENIIIPKIVISDESELDNECELSSRRRQSSPVSPKQEVHPVKLQEKQKYYRRKRPKAVSPIPEGDDHKMAAVVAMETVPAVREASDSAVEVNPTTSHNNSSQSGADLERAFTDLLDNFDEIGENDDVQKDTVHSSGKKTDGGNVIGDEISCEEKGHEVPGRANHNSTSDEKGIADSCDCTEESIMTDQGEVSLLSDMSVSSPVFEPTSPLVTDEGFDVDRIGDVVIEESEEGALTATDVQELDQGQRKVSVTTKKNRTGSDAEYQDKETTVITTFESPAGTKYEEQDVIKTRRKLTPKGSIYVKRDTVRTKRALTSTGEQTVEEDHIVETDNKSVSLGKSWGDKTLTTVVLSKPTRRNRAIPSIQEETTAAKPAESSSKEGIPDIILALGDQDVDVGSMVTLRCQGTGVPNPEVTWYAGSNALTETAYFKPSFDGKTAELVITEVFPDDEQLYRCVFRNCHGSAETSCNLTVTAVTQEEVPSITSALEDVEASPGEVVTMQCGVKGLGEIFWHKEGTRLKESHKYEMKFEDASASLRIRDVVVEDAGQYSCSVKNTAGESSTICQLLVTIEGCPPDILNPLFNCTATCGKPFKLMCRISGDPEPSVSWYHEGRELKETATCKPSYMDNIARLELKPVTESDGGGVRMHWKECLRQCQHKL
ncbi:titin-like isoform X1 [Liolophura sinensis]|uniref:titin-like isoform X1 n=1 Tax=Liolophura sinensis TaxID=3198878 RepID=UPI0031598D25